MPVAFANTVGRPHTAQPVLVTGLTPSTAYKLLVTDADGHLLTIAFTTDGSGAASPSFVPNTAGAHSAVVVLAGAAQIASTNILTPR